MVIGVRVFQTLLTAASGAKVVNGCLRGRHSIVRDFDDKIDDLFVLELAQGEVLSILSKFTEPEDSTKKAILPWSHSPLHERWRRARRKAPWFRKHLWL